MLFLIGPGTVAAVVFVLAYSFGYWIIGAGPFEMDPGGEPKAFEEHLKRYQNLFQLLITLSTATVGFVVNFLIGISNDKPRNLYSSRLEGACSFTVLMLGASVICALLFITFENLAYETYSEYLQTKTKTKDLARRSPYTRRWYAFNLAVGYSSLILFLIAYGFLAFRLLKP
jgi:hypothetical protein